MRRLALVLATAGVLAAGGAWAQTDPAPDPAKIELARQLVQAMGGEEEAEDQVDVIFDVVQKTVDHDAANLDSRLSSAFLDGLKQELDKVAPQIVALSARLYAQDCSQQELRDMLAFENSETGKSMARKAPLIRAQALHQALPMVSDMMPDILARAVDRACQAQQCSAEERKALSDVLSGRAAPPPQTDRPEEPPAPPTVGPPLSPT